MKGLPEPLVMIWRSELSEQFKTIHFIMTRGIFRNPLMITDDGITPLAAIDKSITNEQRYTGISEQEQSSRRVTIERNLERLRSRRRLLESGLEDLPAAERTSERINRMRESATPNQSSDLLALQREFERNIRHIGRWIRRKEELMANLALNYLNSFFQMACESHLICFGRMQISHQYIDIFLWKKNRSFFHNSLKKRLIISLISVQDPDNGSRKTSKELADLIIQKFDNRIALDFEKYGYGFKDYVSDNPDHFTRVMRKLYNAVLDDTAHNSIAVGKTFWQSGKFGHGSSVQAGLKTKNSW